MTTANTCIVDLTIMFATMAALTLKRKRASETTTSQAEDPSVVGSSSLQVLDSPSGVEGPLIQ